MKKRDCKTGLEINGADWQCFEKFLSTPEASPDGGQKHTPNQACLEGLLWLLRSGARYKDMPKHFPSGSTCWLRLLDKKSKLNWKEYCIDLTQWRRYVFRH